MPGVGDRLGLYEAASRVGDASQQLLQVVSADQLRFYRHHREKHLETIIEDEDEHELEENEDYETDSNVIMENAHALDWQLRDDLLAATKVKLTLFCFLFVL